ncbi:MAG: DNA ligase [Planctomycetia bacterium]|nr:DNA ligase [Planctomycetia bacterium]
MPDLLDGESVEVQGSGRLPYVLKNTGGVYSCSCPAWRNQSLPIERRTCKHLKKHRGEATETERIGGVVPTSLSLTADRKPTAPPLLLAETWDGEQDVAGWYFSEKLDGVRAFWDGRQFLSRQGNVFHAPAWFRAELPAEPFDGELWLARKSFQRTMSIVRRQDESDLWRAIRYVVFDAPALGGPFEERMEYCRDRFARYPSQLVNALPQRICRGVDHLLAELDKVLRLGGEGLMLRRPGSLYEAGRSSTLLKVKRFLDAEARVIGHQPGTGRHRGRLGALLVELPNGIRFAVGTGFSDRERERPPVIGSTITFRYQELSDRGVPRFPAFARLRNDLFAAS